jgi:hypothetical protein
MNAAHAKLRYSRSTFVLVLNGRTQTNSDPNAPLLLTEETHRRLHSRTSVSAVVVEMIFVGVAPDEHILSAVLLRSETREQVVEIHTYLDLYIHEDTGHFAIFRNGGTALQLFGSSMAFGVSIELTPLKDWIFGERCLRVQRTVRVLRTRCWDALSLLQRLCEYDVSGGFATSLNIIRLSVFLFDGTTHVSDDTPTVEFDSPGPFISYPINRVSVTMTSTSSGLFSFEVLPG